MPVVSGDFDYGAVKLDISTSHRPKRKNRRPPLSYILAYDLETGEIEDIGTLVTSDDGSFAYGMGAAETDSEGRIWFVGAFEEKDPAYEVSKMRGSFPYSLGLGCYDPFELETNQ